MESQKTGDGRLDVAVANEKSSSKGWAGGVMLMLNEGDGEWTTITLATETEFRSIALVDVNADGLADVIASGEDGTVVWISSVTEELSSMSSPLMLDEDAYANAVLVGDIAGLGFSRPEPHTLRTRVRGVVGKRERESAASSTRRSRESRAPLRESQVASTSRSWEKPMS